ncbi:YggS family pyridoxal phosphate-dependent enzyme [Acetobacteraceae bacterium]|nr:YggS family pyridoxal phosphate-dependent enzyme [Acetobacteraceae bacterium]
MSPLSISQNLEQIHSKIRHSCEQNGRNPHKVKLIAVSKFHPISALEEALQAGQRIFGENYVQEAQEKSLFLRPKYPDIKIHLIGPLQTNKAVMACEFADAIHTLDRPNLCKALKKASEKTGKLPDLFVQINIGHEQKKSGISPEEADDFIEHAQSLFGDKVKGLMCIPPHGEPALPYFQHLAEFSKRHGLKELSMGMSSDFELAIAAGATFVRVGTAIFGARPV